MSNAEKLADIITQLFMHCQEKEAKHVAQYGVSIADARCLRILYEHQPLTVNHLAFQMSLTSSRITRIIDRLVRKQLVLREAGTNDRRIFNLSLTPKGAKLAETLIADNLKIHEEILAHFPKADHSAMFNLLKKLNCAVEDWLKKQ